MKLLVTICFCFVCLICKTYAQVNEQDSLALVDLYNSTNGKIWDVTKTWLSPAPVSSWYCVVVENNRVTQLNLENRSLNGKIPVSIGNLTALINLDLSGSSLLSGEIPPSFGNLINLQLLDLSNDALEDTIPKSLGNLNNLKFLSLFNNQLTGIIPSSLGNLINLQKLYLSSNHLSGSIPPSLGNLANLILLYLEINQLTDTIPASLGNLINLIQLELDRNQLSGSIPPSLGNLSSLQNFDLWGNQLTDSIPSNIGNLHTVRFFDVTNNHLSGNIPSSFGNLYSLQYCSLGYNQLTGPIPFSFSNLINLKAVSLSNNSLNDSVHSFWSNLPSLTSLDLSNNALVDSIPSALGNSKSLQQLNLESNHLTGNIPDELGNMSSLLDLNLSSNQLTGNIPSGLNNTKLYSLDLSENKLTGNIPYEIGQISILQKLNLNDNDLSGIVPTSLNNLSTTAMINLSYNNFTFDGIEQLAKSFSSNNFYYSPQDSMQLHYNANLLSVSAGGTLANNTYRWYKNGSLKKTITGDSTFMVKETGRYKVTITNSIATKLTLLSYKIDVATLPVSLLSFTAQKQNNATLLQWQTANEINNNYFSIERSADSKTFSAIGTQQALTSNNANNYSFVDSKPLKGINYYRLKQVDKDGKYTYSKIISVVFTNNGVFVIAPNPATNFITVTIPSSNVSSDIFIYTVDGKKVLHQIVTANSTSTQINIAALTAGVYSMLLVQDGKKEVVKMVKK